jgi:hypothetical protein
MDMLLRLEYMQKTLTMDFYREVEKYKCLRSQEEWKEK